MPPAHEEPADELRRIVRRANAVGALSATRVGAIPALPTAAAVDEFLAERADRKN